MCGRFMGIRNETHTYMKINLLKTRIIVTRKMGLQVQTLAAFAEEHFQFSALIW